MHIVPSVFDHESVEPACLASEGKSGRISKTKKNGAQQSHYHSRREFGRFCELQGLPADFLSDAPFTISGKYLAVGNGVPLPMGRAVAKAVKTALQSKEAA